MKAFLLCYKDMFAMVGIKSISFNSFVDLNFEINKKICMFHRNMRALIPQIWETY